MAASYALNKDLANLQAAQQLPPMKHVTTMVLNPFKANQLLGIHCSLALQAPTKSSMHPGCKALMLAPLPLLASNTLLRWYWVALCTSKQLNQSWQSTNSCWVACTFCSPSAKVFPGRSQKSLAPCICWLCPALPSSRKHAFSLFL